MRKSRKVMKSNFYHHMYSNTTVYMKDIKDEEKTKLAVVSISVER